MHCFYNNVIYKTCYMLYIIYVYNICVYYICIIDTYIDLLLCARHDSKLLACVNSFNPHYNPTRWVILYPPIL